MGFSTPSYGLSDLFARIDRGDIQLPDFQRDYSWDVDRIRSLVVTVLRGYPVGCFMALDTRNTPMRFRPRPLDGAPDTGAAPGMLLLDGQQRLTTLYHTLQGEGFVTGVNFRGRKVRRAFYVDVEKATSADVLPDEAVFAVAEDGRVCSHFGPAEVGEHCIPVSTLLGEGATNKLFDLIDGADESTRAAVKSFYNKIVYPLAAYSVPMIRLSRETARAGVGSIFAQANSAGLQMDVFELLTAVFATEDENFSLAQDWEDTQRALRKYPALDGIDRTAFLTAVSLLATARKGHAAGNREDILALSLAEYRKAARDIRITMREAAEFLIQRCIFDLTQVPYAAQIVPLSVILALLSDTPAALTTSKAWDRLDRWFWSGVLGELYGSAAVVNRMANDVDQVSAWIKEETEDEPKTVRDAVFHEERLYTVDETSGIFHGIYAFLMSRGARDWRTSAPFDRWTFRDLNPTYAQIFPEQWCREHGVAPNLAGGVLNRTPMGKRTEVVLDGFSPARYLPRVQSKSLMEDDEFDAVLSTHHLDSELLHSGQAQEFLEDRAERLVRLISQAMGKDVIRSGEGALATMSEEKE